VLVMVTTYSNYPIFHTVGLSAQGSSDIRLGISDAALADEATRFLEFLVEYQQKSRRRLHAGETLAYGYWIVKFVSANDGYLDVWESDSTGSHFIAGVDRTLRYWRDQNLVCQQYDARFAPPRPDQLTVVDEGTLRGLPVQAVRYASPEHMSGWWITTDAYDGNINTLRHEHTYHITAARPELTKYLALPSGFRFDLSSHEDVWYDEKAAKEH
jgi:hypothetical protein